MKMNLLHAAVIINRPLIDNMNTVAAAIVTSLVVIIVVIIWIMIIVAVVLYKVKL